MRLRLSTCLAKCFEKHPKIFDTVVVNLIKAGVGATLKEGELAYHLESDKVDVKYVKIPYTAIADSTVNVSNSEIESSVKEHKNEFKQDASRDIRYVYFEESASEDDINEVKTELSKLLEKKQLT